MRLGVVGEGLGAVAALQQEGLAARHRGQAGAQRIGLIVAGLEVPHCHLHVLPIESESDLDFARADGSASAESLDAAAQAIREHLDGAAPA